MSMQNVTQFLRAQPQGEVGPPPADSSRAAVVAQINTIIDKATRRHLNAPISEDYAELDRRMAEWELDILRRAGVVVKAG